MDFTTMGQERGVEPVAQDDGVTCVACDGNEYRALFSSSDRLYHTTSKEFQVVECLRCGLLRLSPQPLPEELHRYYPDQYWFAPDQSAAARFEEAYRRLVLRDHIQFVSRALRESGESGPVLDVGCGGGLFLRMLHDRGFRVLGLDLSPAAAALCWNRNGVPAMCGSFTAAPLRPSSCAAVTMFHVVEHLHDPQPYLESARKLLRPQGRLIVQVPNAACWQFRLLGRAWNGVDVPRHLYDYRDRDLVTLLERCGFEVVRRKYFSLRDNPAGLASSLAPGLDPMARRVRGIPEGARTKFLKDLLYLVLVAAAFAPAVLEAACRAGSTVMIEARKKP